MIENYLGASNFVRTLFKEDDEIKELKKENSAIKQRMVQQDTIIQKLESIIRK